MIAVCILNWNTPKDTLQCLESLFQIKSPNFFIVVADNGSTDDSVKQIHKKFPQVDLLKHEKNLGFAEGNNLAIKHALNKGANYILLLNSDTIVHENLLFELQAAADKHLDGGIFGAKIYYDQEPLKIWYGGGIWCKETGMIYLRDIYKEETEHNTIEKTDFACGCALFLRQEVIEKIGLLDPKFFLMWEEVDFCMRAKKAGIATYFVPSAKVWHKISTSFPEGRGGPMASYFFERNRYLFIYKHLRYLQRMKLYKNILIRDIFKLIKSPNRSDKAALRGVCDYFLNHFGPGPKSIMKR